MTSEARAKELTGDIRYFLAVTLQEASAGDIAIIQAAVASRLYELSEILSMDCATCNGTGEVFTGDWDCSYPTNPCPKCR